MLAYWLHRPVALQVRVFEPRPSQRDWLRMVSGGRGGALAALLAPDAFAFVITDGRSKAGDRITDGRSTSVHADPAEARGMLLATATRMAGRVAHIGRTRELGGWEWPPEARKAFAGARKPSAKAAAAPPRTVQAVFIAV